VGVGQRDAAGRLKDKVAMLLSRGSGRTSRSIHAVPCRWAVLLMVHRPFVDSIDVVLLHCCGQHGCCGQHRYASSQTKAHACHKLRAENETEICIDNERYRGHTDIRAYPLNTVLTRMLFSPQHRHASPTCRPLPHSDLEVPTDTLNPFHHNEMDAYLDLNGDVHMWDRLLLHEDAW